MIQYVLVIPTPEWKTRLLDMTPWSLAVRVPTVGRDRSQAFGAAIGSWTNNPLFRWDETALALVWNGQPTGPEGLARALVCLCGVPALWRRDSRAFCGWMTTELHGTELRNRYFKAPRGDEQDDCEKWPTTHITVPTLVAADREDALADLAALALVLVHQGIGHQAIIGEEA